MEIHEGAGMTGEAADVECTLTAHHGRCCTHTEHSWKYMDRNTCCII